jgi:hypothetical protein
LPPFDIQVGLIAVSVNLAVDLYCSYGLAKEATRETAFSQLILENPS